jgi:hypothetical protein
MHYLAQSRSLIPANYQVGIFNAMYNASFPNPTHSAGWLSASYTLKAILYARNDI